jgi:predicted nucleic acid-binding protein
MPARDAFLVSARSQIEQYDRMRDGWLLDTNIISAAIGTKPVHARIVHLFESVPDHRFRLSALTIGEMRKGVALVPGDSPANAAGKRGLLEAKLAELQARFAGRILPIDANVAIAWGDLLATYETRGEKVPPVDALIAVTAQVHNLVLVSHDGAFARMREHVIVYDPLAG